jgi:hypothetical protein
VGCLGFLAIVAFVFFAGRWQLGRLGQRQLQVATAKLDAEDAGWRFEAIQQQREQNQPPANANAALDAVQLGDQVPRDWWDWMKEPDGQAWPGGNLPVSNHLPPAKTIELARKAAPATLVLRTEALRLRDKRDGFRPLTLPDDPHSLSLPHLDSIRRVAGMTNFDALLNAIEKNPNRSISASRAGLGTARAVGDEPFLVSQLVRIACGKIAADNAMQTLAWSEPTQNFAELQAELFAEAEVPWFRIGMRGERAALDKLFDGLQSGKIPPENALGYADLRNVGPQHYAGFRLYKALLPGDRAKCLELTTRYVEAAKLPPHEQLAAVKAIELPKGLPDEIRYVVTRLVLPACERVAEASVRGRAMLLCAGVGIACERFRIKHSRWPRELAELTPELLPAVPLDPFTGKPIRYRVFADRVAIYCFWPNCPMKSNEVEEMREQETGASFGYRLWNPPLRGLPAKEQEQANP